MKNLLLINCLVILIVIFASCDEKITIIEPQKPISLSNVDSSLYDGLLVWKTDFYDPPESDYSAPNFPRIIGENVITTKSINGLNIEAYKVVQAYKKVDGNLVWEYSNNEGGFGNFGGGETMSQKSSTAVYESNAGFVHCIDAETGSLNWRFDFYDYYPQDGSYSYRQQIAVSNEILTFAFRTANQGFTSILSLNLETGLPKEIYKHLHDDNYRNSFLPPITYINQQNDTLIYVLDRKTSWNNINLPESNDIHCYNITTDSLIWKITDIAINTTSSVYKPIIDEETNSVILKVGEETFSIDLHNGNINWRTYTLTNLTSNRVIGDGKVIGGSNLGYISVINKYTGELIYENDDHGFGNCQAVNYHNGKIYAVDGNNLLIVEADTGDKLYHFNNNDGFTNGIAIDEATNQFYAAGKHAIFCFKIPD